MTGWATRAAAATAAMTALLEEESQALAAPGGAAADGLGTIVAAKLRLVDELDDLALALASGTSAGDTGGEPGGDAADDAADRAGLVAALAGLRDAALVNADVVRRRLFLTRDLLLEIQRLSRPAALGTYGPDGRRRGG